MAQDDEELKQATHKAAINLSFYNAGEGQCYRDEINSRNNASTTFHALRKQCEERGIAWKQRNKDGQVIGYLV